jgi:hypothetical protein
MSFMFVSVSNLQEIPLRARCLSLGALISRAPQNNDNFAVKAAVDPVARADMNAQLDHALTCGFAIPKISHFDLTQPRCDSNLGYAVAQRAYPIGKRLSSVFHSITDDFGRGLV